MFVGNVCGKAEEAINFYVSVFKRAPDGARTGEMKADVPARYGKGEEPDKEGTVRYAHFSLFGHEFGAMDSARDHKFAFNEAISFIVPCDTQEEIDYFWGKLSADPKSRTVWLARRQIRPVLADRSHPHAGTLRRKRQAAHRASNPGIPQNEKVRLGALKRAAAG
jgi:predicted 3-demethylubiquinone-9 3-methyltransferase (glyoxalase superfamily)